MRPATETAGRRVGFGNHTAAGEAQMQVAGRRHFILGGAAFGLLAAAPVQADAWVELATRRVRLRRDYDRFAVGTERGRFTRLRLRVVGNTINLARAAVTFGNGETQVFPLGVVISPGTDGRNIDLAGGARAILHVDLTYRRVPGGGPATVTLLGLRA